MAFISLFSLFSGVLFLKIPEPSQTAIACGKEGMPAGLQLAGVINRVTMFSGARTTPAEKEESGRVKGAY